MRTLRKLAPGVIGALVAVSPLLAHHEWPVDRTMQVTIKGTVTAYTWADPHVMSQVTTDRIGVTRPQRSGFDVGAYERP